jgi:hypothetical protein
VDPSDDPHQKGAENSQTEGVNTNSEEVVLHFSGVHRFVNYPNLVGVNSG